MPRNDEEVDLNEEIAYWRREQLCRLLLLTELHGNAAEDEAARVRVEMRAIIAAFDDAAAQKWHDRCAVCGKFIRPGAMKVEIDDGDAAHAGCIGERGFLAMNIDGEAATIINRARSITNPEDDQSATIPGAREAGDG